MGKVNLHEGGFDLVMIYLFIKRLSTPFEKQEAFKLGIIDDEGKKLRDPETKEEKKSYGYLDKLIFNLKKLINNIPGGKRRLASFAAALYLIREFHDDHKGYTLNELKEGLDRTIDEVIESRGGKTLSQLVEEITNATGTAVPGSGDNTNKVFWQKPDFRTKKNKDVLRRYLISREKRDKQKRRKAMGFDG